MSIKKKKKEYLTILKTRGELALTVGSGKPLDLSIVSFDVAVVANLTLGLTEPTSACEIHRIEAAAPPAKPEDCNRSTLRLSVDREGSDQFKKIRVYARPKSRKKGKETIDPPAGKRLVKRNGEKSVSYYKGSITLNITC